MKPKYQKIHNIDGDLIGAAFMFSTLAVVFLSLWLTGCGPSVAAVKKQIASELGAIADQQDCPTTCEALKMYIKTKLGGL